MLKKQTNLQKMIDRDIGRKFAIKNIILNELLSDNRAPIP